MAGKQHPLSSFPGFKSLRQRYLTSAIIISITLAFSAYFGWRYVEDISGSQLSDIEHRTDAADALSDTILQLHTIEKSVQTFVTLPTSNNESRIYRSFKLFDSSLSKLRSNEWINKDHTLQELTNSLENNKEKLLAEVKNLVNVRTDENAWLPVMVIMREQMFQYNLQFMSALDFQLMDIEENMSTKTIETYRLINEIRHSWQRMISEFRLFVSNVFGVFTTDPRSGMEARKQNVDLFIGQTDNLISQLEEISVFNGSDEIDIQSTQEMREWFSKWQGAYNGVVESSGDDHWRQDLVLLRNNIQPLIELIHQRASSLQLELGVASAKNISELTSLARGLSDFVIVLATILTIAGLIGYFVFNKTILLPIKNFGLALKNEAGNRTFDPEKTINSQATEFLNLKAAFIDMRDQIRTRQSNLDHMAHHDALTQLPNRVLLRDRLELAVSRAKRDDKCVGLIFLDLDRFKKINDSLGHDTGDQLLEQVAQRLLSCVRSTDTVSRLGGDEFAIVVDAVNADQIANMARKILSSFEEPFKVGTHELFTTTSIGIAMGPYDDDNVDALIKDADIAMYHAKDLGRNTYKFYSSDMAAKVAEYMIMENQLHQAVDADEFFLVYQPIVDIKTGEIISTEALLRWDHPEKGVLAPGQYLEIVEDSGLIRPITQWVLIEASKQYLRYREAGYPNVRMSVNLSGTLLKNGSVLDIVVNALQQTKIDPSGLMVEITEDTLLEDLKSAEKALVTLKEMGIRIALDDFGTGQSSLSHLRLNPIDVVKIDRSFIRDIPEDKNDMELVDAVIAMAHKLHMKVVAEGAETEEQVEFLRWHNCDAIQGYFFSKPCRGSEIIEMLSQDSKIWKDRLVQR